MPNKYLIGIDIGGTKTRGILLDGRKIIGTLEIPTPKNKEGLKRELKKIVKKLKPEKRNFSIGIGVAGIIKKTTLLFAPNIGIRNFNFKKFFSGIPLKIDNDARSFLRGEILLGIAKGAENAFGFTIGTGIGRAYARKGVVKKIKKFEYPEKWEKEYQKIRDQKNDLKLIKFLGVKLSNLLKQYRAETIIIGGGLIEQKDFFNKLTKELRKQGIKSKIKPSNLGRNSAAIGATLI